ncbi:caspase family protein [Micromonospora sp. RP3T]|uniref:wHTH domain-containing protein n=1 Tax=Micromonospora sp. RP3T TaxID=2135446 RepID=UPI000D152D5B|nr:caspase family protein [Micromonospora sp. RP3T]PTA44883.1 hypothetical protein C8054_18265 [Micromonospora sp. RP3T]
MAAFRALLLGVAEYDDPQIVPLPFVPNDIGALSVALEETGYRVRTLDGGRLSRPKIYAEVGQFLGDARPSDNLLVYLSGHGAHTEGVDYLVPSEADLRIPLRESMVPLNYWAGALERSRAGQVVFVVDACREGFDQQSMAPEVQRWSTGRINHVGQQRIAFLFACGPGEKAQFVSGATDSFSFFSRALQQVLAGGDTGRTLDDLVVAINAQVRDLTEAHGRQVQTARVNPAGSGLSPFPPAARRAAQRSFDWVGQARSHRAWSLVSPSLGGEELRSATITLVEHLLRLRRDASRELTRDPWHEPGLATRMTSRVEFLTGLLASPAAAPAGELCLSGAEAALLVAGPYLYDTFWTLRAARTAGVDPGNWATPDRPDADSDSYRRFAQGFPRLWRRLNGQVRDGETAAEIGWWLFHRWIARRSLTNSDSDVAELLPLGLTAQHLPAGVFEQARVAELIRSLRGDPGFLARVDRPGRLVSHRTVCAGTAEEQPLRERLVAYLLSAGRAMAVEATALSEVVVEHMGISDPVSPEELRSSIESVEWESRGPVRVLRTTCPHPAIEIALRAHVDFFDALLVEIQDAAAGDTHLQPLSTLPAHASADQVRPSEGPDGRAYQSAGVRFHLAEDRIQELLMGEQLYGDPLLAIRELYQNALDACRHRAARTEYLHRTGRSTPAWEGRIEFVQGRDERGRPYLECTDNGVGMGVRELTGVFSQAGTRFVETSEFVEEQSRWSRLDPPIDFFPNSRFGVGVLSYFMLADEITVDTCRFDQEGRPGNRLRVSIAGPGNLFRIRETGPGRSAGTTVRLHLRRDTERLSCLDFLRQVLWVAEFRTTVTQDAEIEVWLPGHLSMLDVPGVGDPMETAPPSGRGLSTGPTLVKSEPHPVWWCDRQGAVLVDGIFISRFDFGAVVNLHGRRAPRLSVNRRQILDDVSEEMRSLLRQAAGVVSTPGSPLFTHDWVSGLTYHQPLVADAVVELAIAAGRTSWPGSGRSDELVYTGCYPPDATLNVLPPGREPGPVPRPGPAWGQPMDTIAASVETWRLVAWIAAGLHEGELEVTQGRVIRARPSDSLISADGRGVPPLSPRLPIPVSHLITAADSSGLSCRSVAARLVELGYPAPAHDLPDATSPTDRAILSGNADGRQPWLYPGEHVPAGHLATAAGRAGITARAAAARLRTLGFVVQEASHALDQIDLTITSANLNEGWPWLRPEKTVSAGRVHFTAAMVGISPGEVVSRLRRIGYRVEDVPPGGPPTEGDIWLLWIRDDPTGYGPYTPPSPPLPVGARNTALPLRVAVHSPISLLEAALPLRPDEVLAAAARSGLTPRQAADRLRQLGYRLTSEDFPDAVDVDDLRLLSRGLDGRRPWLDSQQVPLNHLFRAAERLRLTPAAVAARLARFGYEIPAVSLPQTLTLTDLALFGGRPSRRTPWPEEPLEEHTIVPPGHILLAAQRTGLSPAQVTARYRQFGLTVGSGMPNDGTSATDLIILSADLNGEDPWLAVEAPVPVGHVVTAAHRTGLRPRQVAIRLGELGHTTSEHSLPDYVSAEDTTLVSRDLNGERPWADPVEPLSLGRLVMATDVTGLSPTRVSQRLVELGFRGFDEWHTDATIGLPEGATVRLVPVPVTARDGR